MKKILILFFTTCYIQFGYAQELPKMMDSIFTWQSQNHMLMGNLLVADRGKMVWAKSFGYQNIEKGIRNNDSSAFALASIAKIFTSTAVLQLAEQGKLKIDNPFSNYFPDFPFANISIRQLLTHTSGLPEYELFDSLSKANPKKIFENSDVIPALKIWPKPLYFEPGSGWSYSSMNFCLLALLVEKIAGMSLSDYFNHFIFTPAGMHQTYIDNLLISKINSWRTLNYETKPFNTELIEVDSVASNQTMIFNYGGFTGQGSITSTVSDLLLFDQAFFSGKLLTMSSIKEALTPAKLNNGKEATAIPFSGFGYSYYGLGWFIAKDQSLGKIVYHPGGRPGVGTIYVHNITKNQTVILLENMGTGEVSTSSATALRMLNGKSPIKQKISAARTYANDLYKNGKEHASNLLEQAQKDQSHYTINAEDWLDRVKDLFLANHKDLAIEMVREGVTIFPNESVMNEAYGDVLSMSGNKQEAIKEYRKSISENSKNETAKQKLSKLESNH